LKYLKEKAHAGYITIITVVYTPMLGA